MRVTSLDYPLSESIQYKIEQFEESLKKIFKQTNNVHLILAKETPHQHRINIHANVFGKDIHSQSLSFSFHKAFKTCTEHFIHSVIKNKEIVKMGTHS